MTTTFEAMAMAGHDVTVNKREADATAAVLAELPTRVDLVYVDRGESLNEHPKMMQAYVADDYETLCEADDWYLDYRFESCAQMFRDAVECAEVDMADVDEEVITEAIYSRDESDPITDLVRNTSDQLFRANLAQPFDQFSDNYGDTLEYAQVIWYDDLMSARDMRESGCKRFVFDGGCYLAIDAWNGTGDDMPIEPGAVLEIDPESITLDKAASGYTWTDIAGPYEPYYAAHPKAAE